MCFEYFILEVESRLVDLSDRLKSVYKPKKGTRNLWSCWWAKFSKSAVMTMATLVGSQIFFQHKQQYPHSPMIV
jgi:hypothetical protein